MERKYSAAKTATPPTTASKNPPLEASAESADLQADELRAIATGRDVPVDEIQTKPASRSAGAQSSEIKALARAPVDRLAESLTAMAVQRNSGGQPLSDPLRSRVEPVVGVDLGGVRVHSDWLSQLAAANLGARAFTYGRDIYLGAGERASDVQLMAHELGHVAQQGSRDHAPGRRLSVSDPQGAAEREADAVARQVQLGVAPIRAAQPSAQAAGPSDAVVQRKLIANGDRQGFVDLTNQYLEGLMEISVGGNGVTSIAATDSKKLPSDVSMFQTLVNVLIALIADSNTTMLEFTHGKTTSDPKAKNVLVGSYALGMIDIDDLAAVGQGEGVSGASMLIHEMHEQYRKQVHNEVYALAHGSAVEVEEAATGCKRGTATMKQISPTTIEATVPFTYPNGKVVNVKMTIESNNIIKVERTVVKEADKK